MLTFQELTEARRTLQSFCLLHVPSLLRLQSGNSFKLLPTDRHFRGGKVHHLTTSATCYASVFECPPRFWTTDVDLKSLLNLRSSFADEALVRPNWTSEGSAGIYCRCRALPMVIGSSTRFVKAIENHIGEIIDQLGSPKRFGIGEAGRALPEERWYPPNAFHTYWTLETLGALKSKYVAEFDRLSQPKAFDLRRKIDGMSVWGKQQLGSQLGLHSASPPSSMLDSDQLAWSLAIFLRFDEGLNVDLENRDFIKQALKCLFLTQTDGTWRHYKPLFHYKKIGNAYCYVFETFTALLQCALRDTDWAKAEMVRELLRPYDKNLMDLWSYADVTSIPLSSRGKEVGWCSGHRTNVTLPESWATASVFSYAQALRRLLGIWCREEAESSLNIPRSRLDPERAMNQMDDRGKTWGPNKIPVSEQLWTMFINPVRMHDCTDKLEPDSRPIEEQHARSAILFGPPGTSKTTLARLLADIIEWRYIEIHASHFVAEGLADVQKTADRIFKQLLELDHAVVLFDEIDELVREREMEKDAFGRFLTTSMLPKLAELWTARKIIYFVATNHINYFDSAVIRSHRFDSLVLVGPPSFPIKIKELERLLSSAYGLSSRFDNQLEAEIQQELGKVLKSRAQVKEKKDWGEETLSSSYALAKFALLRFDELDELAYRLSKTLVSGSSVPRTISPRILREALGQVADSEWRKNKSYSDFFRDMYSERRDYQMTNVWEVVGDATKPIPRLRCEKGLKWLAQAVDNPRDIKVPGFELRFKSHGRVQFRPLTSKAHK